MSSMCQGTEGEGGADGDGPTAGGARGVIDAAAARQPLRPRFFLFFIFL